MRNAGKLYPLIALGLLLSGCKKSEPAATTASSAPTPPPAQPAAPAAAPAAKVNLATVVEYDKKVRTDVTVKNMAQELEGIEKQLK